VRGGGPVVTATTKNGSVYLYNGALHSHPDMEAQLRGDRSLPAGTYGQPALRGEPAYHAPEPAFHAPEPAFRGQPSYTFPQREPATYPWQRQYTPYNASRQTPNYSHAVPMPQHQSAPPMRMAPPPPPHNGGGRRPPF
jgi:hypothetical protein